MENKEVILRIAKILKKKIVVILLSIFLGGGGSFYISAYFLQKKYSSNVQMVYVIENTSSKDEVTAKTTLLKTFKRMMLSNKNLETLQSDFLEQTGHLISVNDLKRAITITQEQDELMLTIKVEAASSKHAAFLANLFSQSSIVFIKRIYASTGELKIVSEAQENKQSIYPRVAVNVVAGGITGFIFSVSVLFIQNQYMEIKKRRATIYGNNQ